MRTTVWRVRRLSVEDFNIHACTISFSKWCFSLILVMLLFTRHHLHFHFHLIMLALSVSLLLGRERITPGNRGLHELLTCFGVFSRAVKASLILLARVLTFSDTFYFELWIYRSRISKCIMIYRQTFVCYGWCNITEKICVDALHRMYTFFLWYIFSQVS